MAIGPVQLLVLGFDQPNFQGEIIAELDRLRESEVLGAVRNGLRRFGNVRASKRAESEWRWTISAAMIDA